MQQVLFYVPFLNIPVYGYGAMLFVAFVLCMMLAVRLGKREGVSKEVLQDLALWIFVFGIIGARVAFFLQFPQQFQNIWQFFAIWQGGLIFYGSAIGGVVGYFVAYFLYLRKRGINTWKMIDIIAPCGVLGLCLGRVGCLLNGCCYGNVACTSCPAISFPLSAQPRFDMTNRGHQTAAGFIMRPAPEGRIVAVVEGGSPAQGSGLKPGDQITKVNEHQVDDFYSLSLYLSNSEAWPRGVNTVTLGILRDGQPLTLPPFGVPSIGLHPTQIYETISMALLLFFLLSYYPYKQRDGSVMVLFMLGYAVHRYLNEMLRTDTPPVAFGLTLSQNISILVFVAGLLLGLGVWLRAKQAPPGAALGV